MTNEKMFEFLAIVKLERELNKNFEAFGGEGFITLCEATRKMPPELRQQCYDFLDKLEETKNKAL